MAEVCRQSNLESRQPGFSLKFSFADYNLPYVEVQDFHDETP